ncbi:LITAF-like zinc ribbon domain-containing protein [Mortierella sp. GBAus27b]|nr:hypothetical protein BGX31_011125 [Mortierella sp. GBA43]KAI8358211.1 LITAF-like zinc ribbon domain-containing protein [Mortierella sp. GBAus27b]
MSDKKDKKGQYAPVPMEEDLALTHPFQPPPYTPSAPTSPFIQPHQAVAGPSTPIYNAAPLPQQPYQPAPLQHQQYQQYQPYQQDLQPHQQQPHQHQHQHHQHHLHQQQHVVPVNVAKPQPPPNTTAASPLILMSPPSKVEDLKTKPRVVICQHCNYLVLTETSPENGSCTYVGILGLLLAGVTSCGCCLLPLCMGSCKDVMHFCPNCHEEIGLYSRLRDQTFPTRRQY